VPSSSSTAYAQIGVGFRQFLERNHIPGLAYGLVIDGELVAADGMGIQNITDKTPVTPDSVFRIASMSKSFTAMAVVRLRDDGKLQLDTPVEQIVPELAGLTYPTRDSAPITVRNLLTMSGGFPQDDPWADRQLAVQEATLSAWMRGGISFSNPPGVIFEYSNYGYAILGRVVTNVVGKPYQRYIQEEILEPLGMTSTTFDVHRVAPERLAMGYRWEDNRWQAEPPLEDGTFGAMGGLFTTINDFARYMAFLLSAFPPRDDDETGPVRRSSVREMQQAWRQRFVTSWRPTPDAPAMVLADGYGYGLVSGIDSVLGYSVAHGGGLPGYGSFYRLLPHYGVGLAAFTNLTYAGPSQAVYDGLRNLHAAGVIQPRTLKATDTLLSLQDALTRLYNQWDDNLVRSIATETFFQDMPLEKRRQQFETLRASFGRCTSVTPLEPENALRGRWRMKCRAGHIELFATMSPTVPPKLQYLEVTPAQSLTPVFRKIAAQMVRLINQWDDETASALLDRKMKRGAIRAQLDALRVLYGRLRLGDVLEGDGATDARVRLLGKQGLVDMRLKINPKTGKVLGAAFTRPRETAFVP
jgi:CubicO group peptidase (beta-lactamase class C family)